MNWVTKYSVYDSDDYKRCICDSFGIGKEDCPLEGSEPACNWTPHTLTSNTLWTYMGLLDPLIFFNSEYADIVDSEPTCTNFGSRPADFILIDLIIDNNGETKSSNAFVA